MSMMQWWMVAAAIVLFVAAAIHFGAFGAAYAHERARIPETVIGIVLLAGALAASVPGWGGSAAFVALVFGLLGVVLGIVLVFIGVGPHSTLDYALHALMLVLLVAGLFAAWQGWGPVTNNGPAPLALRTI